MIEELETYADLLISNPLGDPIKDPYINPSIDSLFNC